MKVNVFFKLTMYRKPSDTDAYPGAQSTSWLMGKLMELEALPRKGDWVYLSTLLHSGGDRGAAEVTEVIHYNGKYPRVYLADQDIFCEEACDLQELEVRAFRFRNKLKEDWDTIGPWTEHLYRDFLF